MGYGNFGTILTHLDCFWVWFLFCFCFTTSCAAVRCTLHVVSIDDAYWMLIGAWHPIVSPIIFKIPTSSPSSPFSFFCWSSRLGGVSGPTGPQNDGWYSYDQGSVHVVSGWVSGCECVLVSGWVIE